MTVSSATLVSLLLGVPAGYGIAKAKANKMAGMLLLSRMTPGLSYLIPLFTMFQILGLIGTVWPIALTHLVITLPIVVWIMIGFFETLPHELEEAARIDGASPWMIFRRIILPLARPGIAVTALFSFMTAWNEFIQAATFMDKMNMYTAPVGLRFFVDALMQVGESLEFFAGRHDGLLLAADTSGMDVVPFMACMLRRLPGRAKSSRGLRSTAGSGDTVPMAGPEMASRLHGITAWRRRGCTSIGA